ncbi:MAG TPA: PfkB family carbohydrate kinase [Stellaceae bacterium]|jgi:rfaE bifunctional protein nucleotidyltransferase chain/domain|nr:PfkB family carbohydrate kinase [Stellaceae bacterium]
MTSEAEIRVLPRAFHPPKVESVRDKVRTLDELGTIARHHRSAGRSIVQAHGAFDLLHLGHVRHLEAARRLGDVLVVTVTADRFVNKGPGRPVFNEGLRAEMLAALEYVDWVAINPSPDAVSAITAIKPRIYVKGQDYQNPAGDVTGKITAERIAVEKYGGLLAFTDEATFSSSELINRHLNVFEPHIREHLSSLRGDGGLSEILGLLDRVSDYRVLIVGDAIIDEYQYVLPMGKSPKENMIATRYQDEEVFAGGVFAAANHVASFCAQVDVVTSLGAVGSFEDAVREQLLPNVRLHNIMRPGAPTTRKRRFIDPSYMRKLFEVYYIDDDPMSAELQQQIDGAIAERVSEVDVVIAADFGHGLLGPSSIEVLTRGAPFLAVNCQSNSANMGFNLITKYPRSDYVCIDAPEARLATGDRTSPIGDIARRIEGLIGCSKIIITQGKHGCVTHERGGVVHTIPAFAKNVVDTVGAGDAFLSVTSPLVAAGGAMHQIGFIGNVVGALKVEIVGHRRFIEKPDLVKAITALLK